MRRRKFIGSATLVPFALSGCVNPVFGSDEPSFRTIDVANVMDLSESGYEMNVEVTRQPDADNPGKIRISLTNTTGQQQTLTLGATPPFTVYWGYSEDVGEVTEETQSLQLVPESREYLEPWDTNEDGDKVLVPDSARSGCWTTRDKLYRNPIGAQSEIEPDETISEIYTVVGYTQDSDCLPPGSYTFEDESYLGEDEPWAFTLQLTGES